MLMKTIGTFAFGVATAVALAGAAKADAPAQLAAPGTIVIATWLGEGAQIYDCKMKDGKLAWVFREPIATLLSDGKTVGRHYAGPSWESTDGGIIVGKVAANAPGASANDIPQLKLEVVSHRGNGVLADAAFVQRLDTHGGALQGTCDTAGAFRSVPYSATYVFLKKAK